MVTFVPSAPVEGCTAVTAGYPPGSTLNVSFLGSGIEQS